MRPPTESKPRSIRWTRDHVNIAVEIVRTCRPALLAMVGGNPRTCIFCTRVACGVFSRLGIANRPLPVELDVYNPALWDEMNGGEPAEAKDTLRYYIGTNPSTGWEHIDGSHLGKGWHGHLVCLVENRLLLDLSLDQVNRPQYGIELEAAVIEPPAEEMAAFLAGDRLVGEAAGCGVCYRTLDDREYLSAGDWDRQHTRGTVLSISDAIQEGFAEGRMPSFATRPEIGVLR